MHATERVRVSRLLSMVPADTGTRRHKRRASAAIRLEDGTALRAHDHVTLSTTPLRFHAADLGWEAALKPPGVLALHKPSGVITSRHEPGSRLPSLPSVLPHEAHAWSPVGRLDAMASGLLLVTEDGQLCHRLAHPRYGVERTYLAGTLGTVDSEALNALRMGVLTLRDGHIPSVMAVEPADAPPPDVLAPRPELAWWHVTLAEGRYHEVRRMLGACSLRVEALVRTHYGPLSLEALGLTEPGAWTWLDHETRSTLQERVGIQEPPLVLQITPWEPTEDPAPPASTA